MGDVPKDQLDGPTLDEVHLGLDMLEAVWHGGAWCDPLTVSPIHACADCRPEVTHRCPPKGLGLTPCCGRTPFELPLTDRMTLDPELVTCAGFGS